MSVFFSRFMRNESQCGTNKSREPRSGAVLVRFVCSALRFILQQRPLLKFSEQSKKFKFPAEIGHLTLFQDKTILAYSFREAVLVRFVCSALRFISHEPRKKDRSSRGLFVPHCDSFPMNREKRHSFLIFTMPQTKTPSKILRAK